MRPTAFLIGVLTVTPLTTITAQEHPPLEPGQRVRITAPHLGISKHDGTLVAVDSDTLTVDSLRVALMNVTRLDVHRGQKTKTLTGMGIGTAIGAGTGAILGAIAFSDECLFEPEQPCPGAGAFAGAVLLGVPGLLVGTIVGALTETDRWEEVPLDQLRVSFGPQRGGGLGFGLSVAF